MVALPVAAVVVALPVAVLVVALPVAALLVEVLGVVQLQLGPADVAPALMVEVRLQLDVVAVAPARLVVGLLLVPLVVVVARVLLVDVAVDMAVQLHRSLESAGAALLPVLRHQRLITMMTQQLARQKSNADASAANKTSRPRKWWPINAASDDSLARRTRTSTRVREHSRRRTTV